MYKFLPPSLPPDKCYILFRMFSTPGNIGNAQVYLEGPAVNNVCYGNTVSLICFYPNIMNMVNGMNRYSSTRSEWAVNGTRLLPDGVTTSARTLNSTSERLNITLTREQFEGSIFYYSCYLVLYNGSRDNSCEVNFDPPGEGVYRVTVCVCVIFIHLSCFEDCDIC